MSLKWSDEATSCAEELIDGKNTSIDYVLFNVENPKKKPELILESKGKGGREKVAEILSNGDSQSKVLTGAFLASAIDERGSVVSVRRKVVHVSFVGSSVGVLTKGKVNGWSGSFREKFPGSAIYLQLIGDDLDDLQENTLEANLLACGGAHKPTRYDFTNATIIGSLGLPSNNNNNAAAAKQKAEEEEAKLKAQGEAARKKREEDAAKKKAEEEEAKKKAEEDRLAKEKADEEARIAAEAKAKQEEEEAKKKAEEDRLAKEKADEEARIAAEAKAKEEEEARKKAEKERLAALEKLEQAKSKQEEEPPAPAARPNLRSVQMPGKASASQIALNTKDKDIVMLLSSQSGSNNQHNNTKSSRDLFKRMGVEPVIVDGADPSEKETRDELFRMSGMRGNYPQFFVKKEGADLEFFGDFETFEGACNDGTLAEELDIDPSEVTDVSTSQNGEGGGKKLILLISSMGNGEVKARQNHVKSIIEGLGVPTTDLEELDGVNKDVKERRDELWGISGVRANYPQLFAIEKDGSTTTFVGDYEQVTMLHDQGSLGQEIGML